MPASLSSGALLVALLIARLPGDPTGILFSFSFFFAVSYFVASLDQAPGDAAPCWQGRAGWVAQKCRGMADLLMLEVFARLRVKELRGDDSNVSEGGTVFLIIYSHYSAR